jgi:hypothetical protein
MSSGRPPGPAPTAAGAAAHGARWERPQDAAQGGEAMGGSVPRHELESSDGIEPVSLANQSAAFLRLRGGFCSLASRRSPSRSSVVKLSGRCPASRSACASQLRMVWADGSNCSPSDSGVRRLRTNSIIRYRNSGRYALGSCASWTPPPTGEQCPRNRVIEARRGLEPRGPRGDAEHQARPEDRKPLCVSANRACGPAEVKVPESIWWAEQGSNLRPRPCKGRALPAELSAPRASYQDFTRRVSPAASRTGS